jgi:NadR type nicotinamide-nucleotide adenylyltransferase
MLLCDAARRLVDELTILVCWLPDDPIAGSKRLEWMRELQPDCRVIGHDAIVPQRPEDDPAFWDIWRRIVREAHPQPVDFLFAGEGYGARLAEEVGAEFVPLGARCMGVDTGGIGGVSATAIRADPWGCWRWLPAPVRAHYARTICLHGPESVGKSAVAERLAEHFGTISVPEYGRAYCAAHGTDLGEAELAHIAEVQQALRDASFGACERRLFLDTDPLMTAAWSEMMLGRSAPRLLQYPKADLYLMLDPDVPWTDDGTRLFGDADQRARFAGLCRSVLEAAGVRWVSVSGGWEERFRACIASVEALPPPSA